MRDYDSSQRHLLVLGYNATLTTAVEAPRQPIRHFDQIKVPCIHPSRCPLHTTIFLCSGSYLTCLGHDGRAGARGTEQLQERKILAGFLLTILRALWLPCTPAGRSLQCGLHRKCCRCKLQERDLHDFIGCSCCQEVKLMSQSKLFNSVIQQVQCQEECLQLSVAAIDYMPQSSSALAILVQLSSVLLMHLTQQHPEDCLDNVPHSTSQVLPLQLSRHFASRRGNLHNLIISQHDAFLLHGKL